MDFSLCSEWQLYTVILSLRNIQCLKILRCYVLWILRIQRNTPLFTQNDDNENGFFALLRMTTMRMDSSRCSEWQHGSQNDNMVLRMTIMKINYSDTIPPTHLDKAGCYCTEKGILHHKITKTQVKLDTHLILAKTNSYVVFLCF